MWSAIATELGGTGPGRVFVHERTTMRAASGTLLHMVPTPGWVDVLERVFLMPFASREDSSSTRQCRRSDMFSHEVTLVALLMTESGESISGAVA